MWCFDDDNVLVGGNSNRGFSSVLRGGLRGGDGRAAGLLLMFMDAE